MSVIYIVWLREVIEYSMRVQIIASSARRHVPGRARVGLGPYQRARRASTQFMAPA